ncbi:MAG TPA: hypothetical protein VHC90_17675 [Bryobacteraceae bacterium]|nr:hypothetical protein [Bryobacteraceae bacterium]
MRPAGSSMSFTKNPLPYLVALLFLATIAVSAIAPGDVSLVPYGPSPNPYEVAR